MFLKPSRVRETIQGAVNSANDGDTIHVHPGEYDESVTINKPDLTLKSTSGAGNTVIDRGNMNTTTLVNITASNVVFDGFTVRNEATTTQLMEISYNIKAVGAQKGSREVCSFTVLKASQ